MADRVRSTLHHTGKRVCISYLDIDSILSGIRRNQDPDLSCLLVELSFISLLVHVDNTITSTAEESLGILGNAKYRGCRARCGTVITLASSH